MKYYASVGHSYGTPNIRRMALSSMEHLNNETSRLNLDGSIRFRFTTITPREWNDYLRIMGAYGREPYVEAIKHKAKNPDKDSVQRGYDNGHNYSRETFNELTRYFMAVANLFSRLRQGVYNMQTNSTDAISKDNPKIEGLEEKLIMLAGGKRPISLSPKNYAVAQSQLELAS